MPAHSMKLEDRQTIFDNFRTTLSGGRVELLPAVRELPARIKGRLLFRIAIFDRFHPESDHSNGAFIFAGWRCYWEIHEEQNGLVMCVGMQEHIA